MFSVLEQLGLALAVRLAGDDTGTTGNFPSLAPFEAKGDSGWRGSSLILSHSQGTSVDGFGRSFCGFCSPAGHLGMSL